MTTLSNNAARRRVHLIATGGVLAAIAAIRAA